VELPVLPDLTPLQAESTDTNSIPITERRILVVDDEPEVGSVLYRALSADGHDVTLAPDGGKAWELIQVNRFDNILLDLKMPGLDGQELYQMIAEFSPELAKKVIFITGDTARAEAVRFLDFTATPVLRKPFTIEAIRQLL
jgi:CheY-like chemotaxis protein